MDADDTRVRNHAIQRYIDLWESGNTSPISWDLCKDGIGFPPAIFNAAAIAYTQESPENMVNFMEWAYKVADRLASCNAREDEAELAISGLKEKLKEGGVSTCIGKIEVRRASDCEIYLRLV